MNLNNTQQPPDLATILQNLAKANPNLQFQQPQQNTTPLQPVPTQFNQELQHAAYSTAQSTPPSDQRSTTTTDSHHLYHHDPNHPRPVSTPLSSQRPTPTPPAIAAVDPQSITTWPAALRHTTRLLTLQPHVAERIRKLQRSQLEHEKEWWAGREGLLKTQRERGAGRKRIEEVLKSVGGNIDASIGRPSPTEDAAELELYDKKVHRAMQDMDKAVAAEFVALGIPFFSVEGGDKRQSSGVKHTLDGGKSELDDRGREKERRELQRQMVRLLQDLCAE